MALAAIRALRDLTFVEPRRHLYARPTELDALVPNEF